MSTLDSSHPFEIADKRAAHAAGATVDGQADESARSEPASQGIRSNKGFILLNVWLAFHLFAIVVCPASAEPSSPLLQSGFGIVAPYLHLLYLDHAFRFFVPEPGASTLVAYSLELPDGSVKSGRFPNRSIYPRLLYHRFFMLSEFLGNGPEAAMPLIERAFARNLCRETGAIRVSLTQVVHDTASMEDIQRGLSLNDPSLFTETPLGTYTSAELKLPYNPVTKESSQATKELSTSGDVTKDIP